MTTPAAMPRQTQPLVPLHLARPESVHLFIQVRSFVSKNVWAVGTLDGESFDISSGVCDPIPGAVSKVAGGLMAAMAIVLRRTDSGRTVVIHDSKKILGITKAADLLRQVPEIVFDGGGRRHREFDDAVVEKTRELRAELWRQRFGSEFNDFRAEQRRRTLTVSTDASVASRGRIAGLGWVVREKGLPQSCGQVTATVGRQGDILVAELLAVGAAVRGLMHGHAGTVFPGSEIRIESDSRNALRALTAVREGRGEGLRPAVAAAAAQVLELVAGQEIELSWSWVKGHADNDGNEAADRLAKLARRNAEFQVPAEMCRQMVSGAQAEILQLAA